MDLVAKFNQITILLLAVLVLVSVVSAIDVLIKKQSVLNILGLVFSVSLIVFMVKGNKFFEVGKMVYDFFMKV